MTNAEIQVGEYARTKQGYIAKLESISENKMYWFDDTIYCYYEEQPFLWENRLEEITKHSFNIIDLIEVGDYVNGDKVDMLTEIGGEKVIVCNDYNLDDSAIIYNNEKIKTIVTKEQFKFMEYKVGGEEDE